MFFAAHAYRELNKVAPDCGTSFTWTTKAFGPYIGWIGGWAAILATAIVLSNLSGVAVHLYQFLGDAFRNEALGQLWQKPRRQCGDVYRASRRCDVCGVPRHHHDGKGAVLPRRVPADSPTRLRRNRDREVRFVADGHPFRLGLVQPQRPDPLRIHRRTFGVDLRILGLGHLPHGERGIEGIDQTPAAPALLTVMSILLTYLLVATATQMYAGVGTEGLGLGNEEISENVFGALAHPVMGDPWHLFLYLAVLASSTANLITTFLPATRTILGMASYKALRHGSRRSTRGS